MIFGDGPQRENHRPSANPAQRWLLERPPIIRNSRNIVKQIASAAAPANYFFAQSGERVGYVSHRSSSAPSATATVVADHGIGGQSLHGSSTSGHSRHFTSALDV